MAFIHYRTQSIFLKAKERGEADKLFVVFTKEFGKIEVLGKAIRKINSKLRAGADNGCFSEISFIQGKTYKILTDTLLIESFNLFKKDIEKLKIFYKMADALDSLVGLEEPDIQIWKLLKKSLHILNIKKSDPEKTFIYFLWNLFLILGYSPELRHCPVCDKKLLPETFFFIPKEGGVVCWQCAKAIDGAKALITIGAVKILRLLTSSNSRKIIAREEDWKNLKEISELYLNFLKEELSKLKEK